MKIICLAFGLIVCFELSYALNIIDVKTSSGVVRGQTINVLNQTINQFLGIPFAEPPIGRLRFAKPEPIGKPKPGIIDATKTKNSCMQPQDEEFKDFIGNLTLSEDCLVLNIWSPKADNKTSTKLKPVMFWIYGGGLLLGSIFQADYNGSALAAQDVVFVSANYRLGTLGFLYGGEDSAPGNVGLYDQVLALKWVRENIHLFGGDKNQITIFGESAGSWSVSTHLLSPLSKGLFKRAIMESGAQMHYKKRQVITKTEALIRAKHTAQSLNCSDDKTWIECLRKVEAKELLTNDTKQILMALEGTEFLPISAPEAFKEKKFNTDIDLIAGVAQTEGSLLSLTLFPGLAANVTEADFIDFVNQTNQLIHGLDVNKVSRFYLKNVNTNSSDAIKWAFYEFFGDILMKCPTYLFAKQYAKHSPNSNVFFYEITYTNQFKTDPALEKLFGVSHGADLSFVFGLPLLQPKAYSKLDIDFSKNVLQMWTNFAKNGKPNSLWPELVDPKIQNSVPKVKDLNANKLNNIFVNPYKTTCEGFWSNYYE